MAACLFAKLCMLAQRDLAKMPVHIPELVFYTTQSYSICKGEKLIASMQL